MLPRWVSGLLSLRDSAAGRSALVKRWCERALCRYVAPRDRGSVTIAIYQKQTMYQSGQPFFSRGVFDWEKKLFSHERFPRSGDILIPAAGGGREVSWFLSRGVYRVVGFDPAPTLVASWNLAHPQQPLLQGSYQDLVRLVQDEVDVASSTSQSVVAGFSNPLQGLSSRSFDAIVLGWGSLSHLLEDDERRALLSALRRRYPRALVALSFLSSCDKEAARAPGKEPIYFLPWAGFVCLLGRISLQRLVDSCGYRILFYSDEVYSHALLCPV